MMRLHVLLHFASVFVLFGIINFLCLFVVYVYVAVCGNVHVRRLFCVTLRFTFTLCCLLFYGDGTTRRILHVLRLRYVTTLRFMFVALMFCGLLAFADILLVASVCRRYDVRFRCALVSRLPFVCCLRFACFVASFCVSSGVFARSAAFASLFVLRRQCLRRCVLWARQQVCSSSSHLFSTFVHFVRYSLILLFTFTFMLYICTNVISNVQIYNLCLIFVFCLPRVLLSLHLHLHLTFISCVVHFLFDVCYCLHYHLIVFIYSF